MPTMKDVDPEAHVDDSQSGLVLLSHPRCPGGEANKVHKFFYYALTSADEPV